MESFPDSQGKTLPKEVLLSPHFVMVSFMCQLGSPLVPSYSISYLDVAVEVFCRCD